MSIRDNFNKSGDADAAISADFEAMGYQLAGTMEFYDNPETGECAFRTVAFVTDSNKNLEEGETETEGQKALLITQALFEDYLETRKH